MLIDNTLKSLYTKENVKDTHHDFDQEVSNDLNSTAKKKKSKNQDCHKVVDRKFEPLLKTRSKKNLQQETFNYQGQGSGQNIPYHSSRNSHNQNIAYSKTVDVPVMQQPWAMDAAQAKPRKEIVHKPKDNGKKVRRVKKTVKNAQGGNSKYDSHFQPSSLSNYI